MSNYLDDLRKTADAIKSVRNDENLSPEQALVKIKKLIMDNSKQVSCWFGFEIETCKTDEFYKYCKMHCAYKDKMKGMGNETK